MFLIIFSWPCCCSLAGPMRKPVEYPLYDDTPLPPPAVLDEAYFETTELVRLVPEGYLSSTPGPTVSRTTFVGSMLASAALSAMIVLLVAHPSSQTTAAATA